MKPGWILLLLAFSCAGNLHADWVFDPAIDLTDSDKAPHFHHLDGAGRRHVAASSDAVAVTWEDDSSGDPQVYLAVRQHARPRFAARWQLSTGSEAYEPAVTAIGGNRWLAAWEQDGGVRARLVGPAGPGPELVLAASNARQVTLAGRRDSMVAVAWAQGGPGGQALRAVLLETGQDMPRTTGHLDIPTADGAHPYQGYPALAWNAQGELVLAWEDRRAGHTRLFASVGRPAANTWRFTPPRQLNEHNAPPAGNGNASGLGSGVMRVMLATDTDGRVRTLWLDKRNAASGYAVWGAVSDDGGRTFGANVIVQDDMGSAVAQWHAALAGGPGGFVAAWDDTREGWDGSNETGDVILSWDDASPTWSDDLVVPAASGEGYQGSPALCLDPTGALHLVWIARKDLSSPSRLVYARARRSD